MTTKKKKADRITLKADSRGEARRSAFVERSED
jgi:hypothetical protein